jgi:ParB family chromosome partitioning protein
VGANPALYADLAGDEKKTNICTDPSCYERKIEAHVEQQCASAKERGEPLVKISTRYSYGGDKPAGDVLSRNQYVLIEKGKDRCAKARKAIVAEGDRTGTVLEVCADSDCKVHFRRTGGVVVQRPERTTAKKKEPAVQARERAEREQQLETAEIERRVRVAVAETVNSKLSRGDVELILASTLHRAWHADLVAAARCFKLDTKSGEHADLLGKYARALSDTELNRFLITFMLLQHASLLAEEAKKRRIDVKAIERSVGQANAARNRKVGNARNGKLVEKVAKAPAKVQTSARAARRKAG